MAYAIQDVVHNPFDGPNSKAIGWVVPGPDELPALGMQNGSGYGCFVAPNLRVGLPFIPEDVGRANASLVECPTGFFCPYIDSLDSNKFPAFCPPTTECAINRLFGVRCLPQGRYEPMLCWPGFYCPDPRVMLTCPSGHYCVSGTAEPVKCRMFSYCPEGTVSESNYGFIILTLGIDLVLALAICALKIRDNKLAISVPKLNRTPDEQQQQSESLQIEALESTVDQVSSTETLRKISQSSSPSSSLCFQGYDSSAQESLRSWSPIQPNAQKEMLPLVNLFDAELMRESLNIRFNRLGYKPNGNNTLLHEMSGEFRSGRSVAIIGPSGAGKTTFLHTLMGKIKRTSGSISINGSASELGNLRKLIGFVSQDDIMPKDLTVREAISFSARARLPETYSNHDIDEIVNSILFALSLQNVQHSLLGDEFTRGISGGERKRVNIGLELAAAPLVLFLDEPTSGIDSTSALGIMQLLSLLCKRGLLVISIIHQPSKEIFDAFDDVLMIGKGGKLCFSGPTSEVKPYFEGFGFSFNGVDNTANVLMDILSDCGPMYDPSPSLSTEAIAEHWASLQNTTSSQENSEKVVDDRIMSGCLNSQTEIQIVHDMPLTLDTCTPKNVTAHPALLQMTKSRGAKFSRIVSLSFLRSMKQQYRSWQSLLMECGTALGAGGMIGFACKADEPFHGILVAPFAQLSCPSNDYLLSLYGTLLGLAIAMTAGPAGVRLFFSDKAVYWRERSSGINPLAYFIGKTISSIFRIFLAALHLTALYVYLTKPTFELQLQYALIFSNYFAIYGMSMAVSMTVRQESAHLLAVVLGLFLALLNGSAPRLSDARKWGIEFLFSLSPNRWATEAQYCASLEIYKGRYITDVAADLFGYESNQSLTNIGIILSLGVMFRVLAFALMTLLFRSKQT
ncbi:hypothetical protein HDU78_006421 [Chytriomyces hyalinus]|nr:hypothetical protein HDU78_006421 [Chytriomyces hyalinus]